MKPETPAPEPEPEPSAPEPEPEPSAPEPEPEPPAPEVPPIAVRCKIAIEGRIKIKKATIKVQSGDLRPGTVEDAGRAVDYDCPEPSDREGIDLIAMLEDNTQVHWKDIGVGDGLSGTVTTAQSKKGLPALTPEQRELLKEQGFELTEPAARPARVKAAVAFWPHKLPWAEIQIKAKGKPTKTVTLAGKRSRSLYPGRYEIFIRKDPEDEFENAGTLTVQAGRSHTVKLLKRPLGIDVTSKPIP